MYEESRFSIADANGAALPVVHDAAVNCLHELGLDEEANALINPLMTQRPSSELHHGYVEVYKRAKCVKRALRKHGSERGVLLVCDALRYLESLVARTQ